MVATALSRHSSDRSTTLNKSPSTHQVISKKDGQGREQNGGQDEEGESKIPIMPNSPTSFASQSRRLRLKSNSTSNVLDNEYVDDNGNFRGLNRNRSPDGMHNTKMESRGHSYSSYSPQYNNDYHENSTPTSKVADLQKFFESKSVPSSPMRPMITSRKLSSSVSHLQNNILEPPSQPTPERFNDNDDEDDPSSPSNRKSTRCTGSLSPTKRREKNQLKYKKVKNQSHFLDHRTFLEQQQDHSQQQERQKQHNLYTSNIQPKIDEIISPSSVSKKPKKKVAIQVKDGVQIGYLPAKKSPLITNKDKSHDNGRYDQNHTYDTSKSPTLDLFINHHNSMSGDKKEYATHDSDGPVKMTGADGSQYSSQEENENSVGNPIFGSPTSLNDGLDGLSDRRRKMAKAKKHARSTTTTTNSKPLTPSLSNNQDYSSLNHDDHQIFMNHSASTHTMSNLALSSSTLSPTSNSHSHQRQQQQYPSPHRSSPSNKRDQTVDSFQEKQEMESSLNDIDGNRANKSKYPASPSRRRKFEIIKESMKHKRNINPGQQQQHILTESTQHSSNNVDPRSLKHVLSTSTTTKMSKQDNVNKYGHGENARYSLSTGSMSPKPFEAFVTDFNSFYHDQQQQQEPKQQHQLSSLPLDAVTENHDTRKQNKNHIVSSPLEQQRSEEMNWAIDQFVPIQVTSRKNEQMKHDNVFSQIPSDEQNDHTNQMTKSNFQPFGKVSEEFGDRPQTYQSNKSLQLESTDFPINDNDQNAHFFALPNTNHHSGNTWDDDDETQFNSVAENPAKKKKDGLHNIDTVNLQIHPLQSNTMSTKSEKSAATSYFSSGFVSRKVLALSVSHTSDNVVGASNNYGGGGDDDESFTGSVGNKSWTGRMRARQAIEYNGVGMMTPDKLGFTRYESPSKRSLYSIEDNHTEYSRFSASQLLTRDVGNNAACVDASKGIEEIKKFAKEDPTSTAVGLGVCGALCGALLFGAAGFVLAVGAAGACYGVSQLPQDKQDKMKKKASSTVNKASEFVTSNCGCGDAVAPTPMKSADSDFDTRSLGASTVTQNGESNAVIPKLVSPKERSHNRQSPGRVNPNRHKLHHLEPQQPDTNAFLVQAGKRKVNRMIPVCCRMTRITPVNQIHSLDPSLHSRAWLDVMASAWTSRDEKNEAMEEILLLAKDKNRARMLLEEGILDSLMYILREFFQSYAEKLSQSGLTELPLETYMGDPNYFHSKLAANCCVALAKAYTSGIISSQDSTENPSNGTADGGLYLPISRQVAQLLHEVPHHMAVKVPDAKEGEKKEIFKLTTEMTIQIAQDLASSITALTIGKIEVHTYE